MTRLTPKNPRVVWLSAPVNERAYFDNVAALITDEFEAHASDFPPGTRIRITAEVVSPDAEVAHE